jgi:hypothetical protein
MRLRKQAAVVLATVLVAVSVRAAAQETVKSFDQLNTRLKIGDTIWVTDAQGRETEGKIGTLSPDALTLEAEGSRAFAARDVRSIRDRQRDSLKNGTLIGLGVGGSLALTWCLAAVASDGPSISPGVECFEGAVVFGGVGTLFGLFIDASSPGKMRVAYRAPGAAGPAHARLSIAPVITPRAKGLRLSIAF